MLIAADLSFKKNQNKHWNQTGECGGAGEALISPLSPKCNCQGRTFFLTIPSAFTYIISRSTARAKPFETRIIAEISRILFQEYLYGDHLSLVITNKSYWSSSLSLILGLLTLEKSLFLSPLFQQAKFMLLLLTASSLSWLNTSTVEGDRYRNFSYLFLIQVLLKHVSIVLVRSLDNSMVSLGTAVCT